MQMKRRISVVKKVVTKKPSAARMEAVILKRTIASLAKKGVNSVEIKQLITLRGEQMNSQKKLF